MDLEKSFIIPVSVDILDIAETHKHQVELIRCCRDHAEPLLLEDGKPILDISQDQFVGIFDLKDHHYFLSPKQIVRFGVFFKLPLQNLISLMMKAEWELFFDQRTCQSSGSATELGARLKDPELVNNLLLQYQPDYKQLTVLIKAQTIYSHDIAFDKIKFYIDELLQDGNFLRSHQEASDLFSKEEITEQKMLSGLPEHQQKAYGELKELYLFKTSEFDDFLLSLECRKKMNLEVENKYFRLFGDLEASKYKWSYNLNKYRMILQLMGEFPDFSYRDLYSMSIERLLESEKAKNEVFDKISRSLNCIGLAEFGVSSGGDLSGFSTASAKFRENYTRACKKILRKLFFLLHTDTCPNYQRLSDNDKTEINQLWLKLMKSTKKELYSFSPSMLLYSLPDIEYLQAMYSRACEILELDPDTFEHGNRLGFLIRQGSSIDKILSFMQEEIDHIETHMARLELIKNEYINEGLAQNYRKALLDPGSHSTKLNNEIVHLKKEVTELKLKIREGLIGIKK